MLEPVGPLAALAVNRALMRGLEGRIAEAEAIADRRAREAYARGLRTGRAVLVPALLIGAGIGGTVTALVVAWFA